MPPAVGWQYDVSRDGQRFLVIDSEENNHPTMILNWPALLKKPQ